MAKLAFKGGQPVRSKPFPTWPIHDATEEKELMEVVKSGIWSFNGPKELSFSKHFADYCGAAHAFCVSNGTVSLEIALRALGIGAGDEVIVPSLTWMATALAVINVGARPIFVDVTPQDWCMDPKAVEKAITSKTRALIPVHLYSQVASMDALMEIAKKNRLKVLEDCAHAHGARWKGQSVGTIGDVGSFSFQQSKAMTSGEGGILITQNEEIAEKIFQLKNCGRPWKPGGSFGFGGNHRITEFQAAVLLAQLDRLDAQIKLKKENFEILNTKLKAVPGIQVLPWKNEVTHHALYGISLTYDLNAFHHLPRDFIIKAMQAEGIPINAPYEIVPLAANWRPGATMWKWPHDRNSKEWLGLNASTPVAEAISTTTGLVIPHYVLLGNAQDMEDIATAFRKVMDNVDEFRFDVFKKQAKTLIKNLLG